MEIESKYNFTKLRARSAYVSHGLINVELTLPGTLTMALSLDDLEWPDATSPEVRQEVTLEGDRHGGLGVYWPKTGNVLDLMDMAERLHAKKVLVGPILDACRIRSDDQEVGAS